MFGKRTSTRHWEAVYEQTRKIFGSLLARPVSLLLQQSSAFQKFCLKKPAEHQIAIRYSICIAALGQVAD